jgi:hypothetical protein
VVCDTTPDEEAGQVGLSALVLLIAIGLHELQQIGKDFLQVSEKLDDNNSRAPKKIGRNVKFVN